MGVEANNVIATCQILIYHSVCRRFRICITSASGKAHTPKVVRTQRLPLGGSWRRRRLRENALHEGFHKPKVTQAPSVTLRVPPSSRRKAFRYSHYNTNRQRKQLLCRFSCVSRTVGDAGPYNFVNILIRMSATAAFLFENIFYSMS